MASFLLVASHLVCSLISYKLMMIIDKYLTKKPPGLQSVLDLLILDITKLSWYIRIFFIFGFLLPGSLYGKLDYFTSQVCIFTLINIRLLSCLQFEIYLVVKFILIFKSHWLNEIMDDQVIWCSRIVAFIIASARFCGDFLVTERLPGPMMKFLTGENHIRYMKAGFSH